MNDRHLLSYVIFAVGVLLLAMLGLRGQLTVGAPLAAAFLIVSVIFYRRGK